jgi:murein DD-endopeptidase MepM/ murein hydrolase activator NlpD
MKQIYSNHSPLIIKGLWFLFVLEYGNTGHYVAVVSNVNGVTVRLVYFHMQEAGRVEGQVKAGDIIGYQGDSGNLKNAIEKNYTVSHVHIKAQENGQAADPLNHFSTKIDPKTGQVTNPCNN